MPLANLTTSSMRPFAKEARPHRNSLGYQHPYFRTDCIELENLISKVGFGSPASETFVGSSGTRIRASPLCETPQFLGFFELKP